MPGPNPTQSVTVDLHSPSTINDWPLSITCTVEGWRHRRGGDVTITDAGGRTNARFYSSDETCDTGDYAQSSSYSTRCDVDFSGKVTLILALKFIRARGQSGVWNCGEEGNPNAERNFNIIGKAPIVIIFIVPVLTVGGE